MEIFEQVSIDMLESRAKGKWKMTGSYQAVTLFQNWSNKRTQIRVVKNANMFLKYTFLQSTCEEIVLRICTEVGLSL